MKNVFKTIIMTALIWSLVAINAIILVLKNTGAVRGERDLLS